jgi:hypothetical protein
MYWHFGTDNIITSQKQWHKRKSLIAGKENAVNTPLINRGKKNIYLPPLHIKLGLIKNSVKTVDHNGAGFMYLKSKFPG